MENVSPVAGSRTSGLRLSSAAHREGPAGDITARLRSVRARERARHARATWPRVARTVVRDPAL